jgi:hypothetical protein
MSRVEGEQSSASREAERVQHETDKRVRDDKTQSADRQAFGKLMQNQKSARDASAKTGQQQQQAKSGDAKGPDLARTALMARAGGAQQSKLVETAKTFQGSLEQAQHKSSTADQGRVTTRDTGKQKDRVERDDRNEVLQAKVESKKDRESELARVEAREGQRPNAAIGQDQHKGSDEQPKDDGAAAAAAAVKKAAQQPQAVQGAKTAQPVKQIPPELLEKLVSTVYLAVTEKGLKEFQIELKDGPLKGGFLKISAENGKVALSFSGIGASEKNLLEASKGDLMRRLEKKGLSLSRFEVK